MHVLHLLSPFGASLRRYALFYLALSSLALIGVGWRGGSSYHKVYPPLWRGWLLPWAFIFTRFVVRQLGYSISLDSQPCLIWTPWGPARFWAIAFLGVPTLLLRGLPSIIPSFRRCRRGLRSGMRDSRSASAQPVLEDPFRFSWRYPSCCQVASSIWLLLAGGVLVGSSWYRGSLLIKGLQSFWRDCFAIASDVPGSRFPTSCYCRLLTKKLHWSNLPFSPTGFLFVAVFPLVL